MKIKQRNKCNRDEEEHQCEDDDCVKITPFSDICNGCVLKTSCNDIPLFFIFWVNVPIHKSIYGHILFVKYVQDLDDETSYFHTPPSLKYT